MEIEGDVVWMTEEEHQEFEHQRLQTSLQLNKLLIELCLLLLPKSST